MGGKRLFKLVLDRFAKFLDFEPFMKPLGNSILHSSPSKNSPVIPAKAGIHGFPIKDFGNDTFIEYSQLQLDENLSVNNVDGMSR